MAELYKVGVKVVAKGYRLKEVFKHAELDEIPSAAEELCASTVSVMDDAAGCHVSVSIVSESDGKRRSQSQYAAPEIAPSVAASIGTNLQRLAGRDEVTLDEFITNSLKDLQGARSSLKRSLVLAEASGIVRKVGDEDPKAQAAALMGMVKEIFAETGMGVEDLSKLKDNPEIVGLLQAFGAKKV